MAVLGHKILSKLPKYTAGNSQSDNAMLYRAALFSI